MFKLKSSFTDNEKETHLKSLKNKLDQLVSILEVEHLETGKNISKSPAAYDLILVTHFENEENLDVYRKHPQHQAVLEFVNEIKEEIIVVDYWKN